MTYQEDSKIFDELSRYRVKCKCSHSIVMARTDRTICSYCGRWVYRTPQIKFNYKIKEFLNKEAKNDNQIRQISKIRNPKSNKRNDRGKTKRKNRT